MGKRSIHRPIGQSNDDSAERISLFGGDHPNAHELEYREKPGDVPVAGGVAPDEIGKFDARQSG
jgi:hypothetical protein